MNIINSSKQVFRAFDRNLEPIVGVSCLIAGIVLLVLATQACHFKTVTPNWVSDYSPRVLQTDNLQTLISYLSIGGTCVGGALFFIKSLLSDKFARGKGRKGNPETAEGEANANQETGKAEISCKSSSHGEKLQRELRFLRSILLILAIVGAGALAYWGLRNLGTLKTVYDLNLHTGTFYSVGYLAEGHMIEYSFAAVTLGCALFMATLLEFLSKIRVKD